MKKDLDLFQIFHVKTNNKKQMKEILLKDYPKSWKNVDFKGYARFKEIRFPKPQEINQKMSYVLKKRKSTRIFSSKKITKKTLSTLLYYSAGLKKNKEPWIGNRFYPSAGARYPLEIYILSLNTELNKGLYHYYLKNHSLEELLVTKLKPNQYFIRPLVKKASFIIIITAIFQRTTVKYGSRGYRHILVEAGHVGQNIYLTAASLNLGVCALAGFIEDELNKLLDIDGKYESVIYTLALG